MTTTTYIPLATTTAAGGETFITFSSISAGYTDLVLSCSVTCSSTQTLYVRFNGDSAGNYSSTYVYGTGGAAATGRFSSDSKILLGSVAVGMSSTTFSVVNASIQNYSSTATKKTILSRQSLASAEVNMSTGTWHNTSAITSMTIIPSSGSFGAGSTFSLYGIKAWAPEATAKATGGYVSQDSTYWYHSFPFSGTFTPLQSLTAETLVIAGGGGGGHDVAGAGGGGGLLYTASSSLTTTPYTMTVGTGGAGSVSSGAFGSNGANSSIAGSGFTTLTATGGGGGGSAGAAIGRNGGSGGGGAFSGTGGSGSQGNNGGSGYLLDPFYNGGGGGGAGGAGASATASLGGTGGLGSSTYSSWGLATNTGFFTGSAYTYAGGGGGGWLDNTGATGSPANLGRGNGGGGNGGVSKGGSTNISFPTPGAQSTGGGGGGGGWISAGAAMGNGAPGGSGIIIVRYVK
jgi:fibronectin-binding autotransporter adhesin